MSDEDEGIGKIVWILMISASISIISSLTIIMMILRSDRGLSKLYYRIMFGLSTMDILHSLAMCFGTTPMPRGTTHAWRALGTRGTCQAQGSIYIFGLSGVIMYNCSLSFYYYFSIKHRMEEEEIKKNIEKYFHLISIGWPSIVIITALATKSINPSLEMCALQSSPRNCYLDQELVESGNCRGSHQRIPALLLLGSVLIQFITIGCVMTSIYRTVKKQEDRVAQYNFPGQAEQVSRTHIVWVRAFSYAIALFITYVPTIIVVSMEKSTGRIVKPAYAVISVLYPLQGLYNLIIFVYNNVVSNRRANSSLSYFQAFFLTCRTFGRGTDNDSSNRPAEIEAFGIYERVRRASLNWVERITSPRKRNRRNSRINRDDEAQSDDAAISNQDAIEESNISIKLPYENDHDIDERNQMTSDFDFGIANGDSTAEKCSTHKEEVEKESEDTDISRDGDGVVRASANS